MALVSVWSRRWLWLWLWNGYTLMLGIVLGFIDGTDDVADDGPILGLRPCCKLGINDGEVDGANDGGLLGKIF